MMKKFVLFAAIAMAFVACDDDDEQDPVAPVIENEEEVITTVRFELTPSDGGAAKMFSFQDIDGDGGSAPIIMADTLDMNTSYSGNLVFLNEAESPAEDKTAEIIAEGKEHQVFYQGTGYTVRILDNDADGNPLGLMTTFVTSDTTGTVTITLRHEPNKTAANVSSGDITNAGGETDIEVTFPLNVR